jgi:cytochrome P450
MEGDDSVQRVTSATGGPAWLVSGYDRVKELLADPRISRSHRDPRHAVRLTQPAIFGGPMGDPETERADHVRMRRLLTRSFSARRMESLRPCVGAIVDELLGGMERSGPPADFHAAVAVALPPLVICELLGVPPEDRADFRRWSDDAASANHPARSRAGLLSLWRYLGALIERRHSSRSEDVVSDLVAVAVIDRGVLLLLTHDEQREALQRDPGLAPLAVEEILRSPSPLEKPRAARRGGLPRYAAADVEVDGATILAGDLVLFALEDANRDGRVFRNPDRFDVTRGDNPHLAFSYGPHFCIGAPLARIELQYLFGRIFDRFPRLRLAVPPGDVRPVPDRVAGAVAELPVSW